ncbi:EAL domain-containing protein [Eubacterium oxidoreducens]|uniref:Diguanylate cyclase (GGDEF) domain-containing protein n=1 Tax=Eubacterium oxidoreducens TaxID=1732 RepID=A0A1G6AW42_EUBOX|nr:EAL domain-containing protein [Eubacterium oxidoreducens]SDB12588.1 diguanylate cyclase (GGDEF) domain-containing protein [Eubacterium oxidoreducens]
MWRNGEWTKEKIINRSKSLRKFGAVVCFCMCCMIALPMYASQTVSTDTQDEQQSTSGIERQTVRVGYYESENFMEGAFDGAKKRGYAYEYLQKIAYIAGWQYEYVYVKNRASAMKELESGDIDVLAGVDKTEENMKVADFPYSGMGREYYYIFILEEQEGQFSAKEKVKGISVGVVKGTSLVNRLKRWNKENKQNIDIVSYDSDEQMLEALENHEIAAIADRDSAHVGDHNLMPLARIGYADFYLAVSTQRSDLLQQLNEAQVEVEESEPYLTAHLSEKYFDTAGVKTQVSINEKEWLNEHDSITIGYLESFAPFSSLRKGKAVGTFIDVVNKAFEEKHIDVEINFVAYADNEEMLEDLKSGKLDLIGPAADDLSATETNGLMQSSNILGSQMILVYKDNAEAMEDGKLALIKGSPIQRTYLSDYYPEVEYDDSYASVEECLQAVRRGEADGTILNTYTESLELQGGTQFKKTQLEGAVGLCYYTTVDKAPLLTIINRGITSLGEDEIAVSIREHTDEAYSLSAGEFIREYVVQIVIGTIIIITLIVVLFLLLFVRNKQKKQFDYMAHRDSMTGTYNRRAYEEKLNELGQEPLAEDIVYASFDIDDLKGTNDTLGHQAGDELIIGTATSLKKVISPFGDIYRLGGDEFVAIFFVTKEQLEAVKLQLKEELSNWNGEYIDSLSVSAGFVEGREFKIATLDELIKHADQRMYREKFAGKDVYTVRSRMGNVKTINGYGKLAKSEEETEMLAAFVAAYEARYDLLTGLPTREYFMEFANDADNPLCDKSLIPTIISFNFNGFKGFNAEYGLTEGDNLLVAFARILEDIFGKEYCARFAEDRFYAMTKREGLEELLKRLFERISYANHGQTLSIRAGIYIFNDADPVNIHTACDRARIACDFEKRSYESRFTFFNEMMKKETQNREYIINNFDAAIERGDIKAYYQPKICAKDGSIVGFEVLARWMDAELGTISPGVFIPILEEYMLTHKLDGYIISKVAEDLRCAMDHGIQVVPVSFNVSKVDFVVVDPFTELIRTLEQYDIPKELIQVEITESNVMSAPRKMRGEIARFRQNGFQVLMDDYGSGYSSLSTLRDFEFDEIKIDMGFMRNFGERSKIILRNTVQMAQEFGIRTLCEGVEEQEQVDFLKEIGCELIQGFYYGKAEPYDVVLERWLSGKS